MGIYIYIQIGIFQGSHKASILEEQERTNAFREQVQEANGRLVQIERKIRDRTDNILTECGALVEEVVQVNLVGEGQEHIAPSDPEEDPEEEPAAPKEVESAGSVTN